MSRAEPRRPGGEPARRGGAWIAAAGRSALLRLLARLDTAPGGRALVAQAEEGNGAGHGALVADRVADPAAVGQDVVDHGAPLGHQLLADAHREGQVGQVVAVQVAELALAEAELDAA